MHSDTSSNDTAFKKYLIKRYHLGSMRGKKYISYVEPICKQITSCSASFPAEDAIEEGVAGAGAEGEPPSETASWDSVAGCVCMSSPLTAVSSRAAAATTWAATK